MGQKKDKQEISIKWYIKEKAKVYSLVIKRCMLCLRDKFQILFSKERLLNKRKEIISKCRHETKNILINYKI